MPQDCPWGCLYIWHMTRSFCRAPNECHEMQAKILHDFVLEQQYLKRQGIWLFWKPSSVGKLLSGNVRRWTLAWASYPGKKQWANCNGQMPWKSGCPKRIDREMASHEHDYPICDVKQEIETSRLLPGGWRGITFSVPELSHIWSKC